MLDADEVQNECREENIFNEFTAKNIISNEFTAENIISAEEFYLNTYDTKKQQETLQQRLHIWAIEYNVTQKSLTALLNILRKEGHNELPSDARTILGTPKSQLFANVELDIIFITVCKKHYVKD